MCIQPALKALGVLLCKKLAMNCRTGKASMIMKLLVFHGISIVKWSKNRGNSPNMAKKSQKTHVAAIMENHTYNG
jgi:hypothetical protein